MNAAAVRIMGRYVGGWSAIVLVVVGLSLLFTFLGTITCAVLVGMMMGVFKGVKWFPVFVSLVFPGVIFGMILGAKVELTMQQVLLLAILCFAAFWVTYLVSAYVFFCEQKEKRTPQPFAPVRQEKARASGTSAPASPGAIVPARVAPELATREWCLKQLQGNWVFEAPDASDPPGRRIIQIQQTKLELKAIDGAGNTTLVATGDLAPQSLRTS